MGGFSLVAGGFCMTLPETMNMPLEEVLNVSEVQEPLEEPKKKEDKDDVEEEKLLEANGNNKNALRLSAC